MRTTAEFEHPRLDDDGGSVNHPGDSIYLLSFKTPGIRRVSKTDPVEDLLAGLNFVVIETDNGNDYRKVMLIR